MPQMIKFDRDRARYVLDCLATGKPIEPPSPSGWPRFDQLMLAGAALCAYLSHPPVFEQSDLAPDQEAENHAAYGDETLRAVAFLSQVFFDVLDDRYDDQWEPTMKAMVQGKTIRPIEGWRPS